jgi:hypothetical protein
VCDQEIEEKGNQPDGSFAKDKATIPSRLGRNEATYVSAETKRLAAARSLPSPIASGPPAIAIAVHRVRRPLECATSKIADCLIRHQGKPEALPQFGNSSSEFLCSDFLVIFYF